MSEVIKFINKIIVPNKFWKRRNEITHNNRYLTIEEVIKRYEELSTL